MSSEEALADEKGSSSNSPSDVLKPVAPLSKLQWKIDLRLVPICILLYLVAFLDRINISNALVLGLQKDLKLRGDQINICLAVFYAPYIAFEIPSNFILQKLSPHVWLSICTFCCGILVMCHGFVQSYGGLLAVRILLGVCEAGILPGCSYLLSMWYKRDEVLRRYTIFFNGVTLAGAFGSLLATAIEQMNGLRHLAGWRWIFIIEGTATACIGIAAFFIISDFPDDVKWLTTEEREIVVENLRADQPHPDTKVPVWQGLKTHFSEVGTYFMGIMYFGANIPGYGLSYFLPTILSGYHYSRVETQLHAVVPFAVAWAWSISLSFLSARINHRLIPILVSLAFAFTGVGILLNVYHDPGVMYMACIFLTMGLFGALPIAICWYLTNLEGHTGRAIGSGWIIGFGNCGGIVATFLFQTSEAPRYHTGYSIITMGLCLVAACCTGYAITCRIKNRSRTGLEKLADR